MRAPHEFRVKAGVERISGGSAKIDAENSRADRLSGVVEVVRLPARAFLAVLGVPAKQADGVASAELTLPPLAVIWLTAG